MPTSGTPRSNCANCGTTNYTIVFAEDRERRAALIRADVPNDGSAIQYLSTAGTPVQIYVCNNCGEIRLFAIER